MSFRTSTTISSRSFDLVRRSLAQSDPLPFTDALTAEQIQQAFDDEGIAFGQPATEEGQQPIYSPAVVLWAMLSQALFTGEERSCRAAVIRVALYLVLTGRSACSTNTGAYSRARDKVSAGVVQRLTQGVAARCEAAAAEDWKWLGRTVRLMDGTTLSLPDTPENQAEYPQPNTQAPGIGFPIMRVLALVSLATGLLTHVALGPYAGKETGETALLRTLFDELQAGELLLGDRYFCGWFMLALLQARGVDFVVRLHQLRNADFRRGRRLGTGDHVVTWPKPPRPDWLDPETYAGLPEELTVREVKVQVDIRGFRTESLVVVTSLVDPDAVSAEDLAALYRQRWLVELHLRDIKSMLQLDVLRRTTPERIHQELWTGLLAYNLTRQSMLQSALASDRLPHELSFTAMLQMLANGWLVNAVLAPHADLRTRLTELRLAIGYSHVVGNRPDRVEPRAIKRRPSQHDLLTIPRAEAIAALMAGC
jgi:putative transposase